MTTDIVADPDWLAHRHDPETDSVHFVHVPRAVQRTLPFLTDEYLPKDAPRRILPRAAALAAAPPPAPLHLILHSAFCCSTLLARAIDRDGVASALSEPVLLNDLVGWKRRGGDPRRIAEVLDGALTLLARPYGPGQPVIVKPSNVLNCLAPALLAMRPGLHAVLLHAPLRIFLGSVARKGMWGRLWVRELLTGQLADGLIDLGFAPSDYLRLTDLQVAAVGWLAQQALFARLAAAHGARVRLIDSELFLADRAGELAEILPLFGLPADPGAITATLAGPAFTRHSKYGTAFDAAARIDEQRSGTALHADEIDKVALWAEAVAANAGVPLPA